EEDFGIAPLEANACGTPVLAFGKGGASETVIDGVTGLHFHEQSTDAICEVVERFETIERNFDPHRLRAHAEQFSTALFRKNSGASSTTPGQHISASFGGHLYRSRRIWKPLHEDRSRYRCHRPGWRLPGATAPRQGLPGHRHTSAFELSEFLAVSGAWDRGPSMPECARIRSHGALRGDPAYRGKPARRSL